MNTEFILYLLKVNLAIVLFYGFYRLLFQRDTLFRCKRVALLSILFISFFYPLGDITQQLIMNRNIKEALESGFIPSYSLPEIIVQGKQAGQALFVWHYLPQMLFAIYSLVAIVLFIRIFIQTGVLFYKISQTKRINLYGQNVQESRGLKTPFSFFKWIVLDPQQYTDNELKEILLHEKTHARQGHSVDTLLSEVMCAFCWFNPFAWLMKREIRMNLEFLADRFVLASGCKADHYQFHLLRLSYHKAAANLSNNFNVSLLKKRIFMMNKKQTSGLSILKYALLLPLVGVLMFFNLSLKAEVKQTEESPQAIEQVPVKEKEIFSHVEVPPAFSGGEKALMEWLSENIHYPKEAVEKKIQGRVIIRFVVDETGAVTQPEIIRSLDPAMDAEALRVVSSMPNWIPGKQGGKPVSVYYVLPILFKL
jgi:TonB family protein